MVRTFIKISLVLLIIVSLPMGFYLVREFSVLNKNERMVERVFSTQLESILFAVNQYSENVLRQWSQTLDQPLDVNGELMRSLVSNLFQNNRALLGVRFLDLTMDRYEVMAEMTRPGDSVSFTEWPSPEKVRAMQEMLDNNYQRINADLNGDQVGYYFLLNSRQGKVGCQLITGLHAFVDQNLRPQIQQISQKIFYIRISNPKNSQVLYETDESAEADSTLLKAEMWYLPDHELGIRLKSKTIDELVSERSQRDNYVLLGMGLLVLLGFMKRLKTKEKEEEYLRSVHRESVRLTDIVNHILDFSRMEKNRRVYHFEELNLNEHIPYIIRSLGSHLENGRASCRFTAEKDNLMIMADPEAFKDMMINLIDNAIKYNDAEQPGIDIRLSLKGSQVVVEVEDNGIGIPARHQKYIFDQFYRVTEGDLAHKAKGSGLGLNLVKRMMKAHNGTVSVRSKPGEGSTFILKFPLRS